jgi:hypothetical protein
MSHARNESAGAALSQWEPGHPAPIFSPRNRRRGENAPDNLSRLLPSSERASFRVRTGAHGGQPSGNDEGTQPLQPPLGRLMNLAEWLIVHDANGSGMTGGRKAWHTSWRA